MSNPFKLARSRCFILIVFLLAFSFYLIAFKVLVESSKVILNQEDRPILPRTKGDRRYFVVFGCSTPDNTSHRGFDYAFYLPLTALAWQRIGFESIILIIGERKEWEADPILSVTLEALDGLLDVVRLIFIPAKAKNRGMLSQTARIFVTNMKDFPGSSTDFILTSDADLWPLRKEHFYPPLNTNQQLFLMHSDCCDPFTFNGRSYQMLPMSHIGASASTWRQIVNTNSFNIVNDSATILTYFQQVFGDRVYKNVQYASDDWYLDQKLVSILVDEWITKQNSKNVVHKVSDAGFSRIDRSWWKFQLFFLPLYPIKNYFDAHLIEKGYLTQNWPLVKSLVVVMYGSTSWQIDWIDQYATDFNTQFMKWKVSQNNES